jgi:hypothetical protein
VEPLRSRNLGGPSAVPHQRAAFHCCHRHVGLKEPFPLGDAFGAGDIARCADPNAFDLMDVYQVTHEIFAPYEYGERLDVQPFSDGLSDLPQSQNPDGSWGDLERNRRRHGPLGFQHIILHTTMVTLDALTIAFHEPWNRDLFQGCEASA